MITLTIRTDKPEAELGLYENDKRVVYETWQAHRQLAETIHLKIRDTLAAQKHNLSDVEAIVVFQGHGSFTGLRIGLSVANALADSLNIPIIASQTDEWIAHGLDRLQNDENDHLAIPEYGAPPHITPPKH